jgi:hypothetical protein
MATRIPKPLFCAYDEINIGKYKQTRHFKLSSDTKELKHLTQFLNINENRFFAKLASSSIEYWVQIRKANKWIKPRLTGLYTTTDEDIYNGDINNKQHLVIFHFLGDGDLLFVYIFENYYTRNLKPIIEFVKNSYTITDL